MIDGINNKTYELLFDDINIYNHNQDSLYKNGILNSIERFTKLKDGSTNKNTSIIFENGIEEYVYNDLKSVIHFQKLSDILDIVNSFSKLSQDDIYSEMNEKNKDTALNKLIRTLYLQKLSNSLKKIDYVDELTTDKRYGCCHSKSIILANELGIGNVVTGTMITESSIIMHSVLEVANYVFDWTRNLVMAKDDYFKLTDFKVINIIPNKCVKEDLKHLLKDLDIELKAYVIFRDEIVDDYNKNKMKR
jgi:hypothetical protein